MAEQMRPASPQQAPDPSRNYERSRPEDEAGMGRLDNNQATPTPDPDRPTDAVSNTRQPSEQQPDHSMHDEEPDGWDQAPTDISNPRAKRHPRTEGRGGTP